MGVDGLAAQLPILNYFVNYFFLDHSFMACFLCFIVKMTNLFFLIFIICLCHSFLLLARCDRLDSVSVAAQHESMHDWLTNLKNEAY